MEAKETEHEVTNEASKAKPRIDISQLVKKPSKSSFYGGGASSSKNYGSTHGMSTQKNHRQKHG